MGKAVSKVVKSSSDSIFSGSSNRLTGCHAMDEKDAARYVGMSVAYLRKSRMEGNRKKRTPAPPYIKIGRSVRYLLRDLDEWLLANRIDR